MELLNWMKNILVLNKTKPNPKNTSEKLKKFGYVTATWYFPSTFLLAANLADLDPMLASLALKTRHYVVI